LKSPVLNVLSNKYCEQCAVYKSKEHIAVRNETIALNSKHFPEGSIRLLFVAESPPMAFAQNKTSYFYANGPMKYGKLSYRMMSVLFRQKFDRKEDFLREFMKEFYLVDMVKCPIDKLDSKNEKEDAIKHCAKYLNEELHSLKFQKAVFVGKGSFGIAKSFLDLKFSYDVISLPFGSDKNVKNFENGLENVMKSIRPNSQ